MSAQHSPFTGRTSGHSPSFPWKGAVSSVQMMQRGLKKMGGKFAAGAAASMPSSPFVGAAAVDVGVGVPMPSHGDDEREARRLVDDFYRRRRDTMRLAGGAYSAFVGVYDEGWYDAQGQLMRRRRERRLRALQQVHGTTTDGVEAAADEAEAAAQAADDEIARRAGEASNLHSWRMQRNAEEVFVVKEKTDQRETRDCTRLVSLEEYRRRRRARVSDALGDKGHQVLHGARVRQETSAGGRHTDTVADAGAGSDGGPSRDKSGRTSTDGSGLTRKQQQQQQQQQRGSDAQSSPGCIGSVWRSRYGRHMGGSYSASSDPSSPEPPGRKQRKAPGKTRGAGSSRGGTTDDAPGTIVAAATERLIGSIMELSEMPFEEKRDFLSRFSAEAVSVTTAEQHLRILLSDATLGEKENGLLLSLVEEHINRAVSKLFRKMMLKLRRFQESQTFTEEANLLRVQSMFRVEMARQFNSGSIGRIIHSLVGLIKKRRWTSISEYDRQELRVTLDNAVGRSSLCGMPHPPVNSSNRAHVAESQVCSSARISGGTRESASDIPSPRMQRAQRIQEKPMGRTNGASPTAASVGGSASGSHTRLDQSLKSWTTGIQAEAHESVSLFLRNAGLSSLSGGHRLPGTAGGRMATADEVVGLVSGGGRGGDEPDGALAPGGATRGIAESSSLVPLSGADSLLVEDSAPRRAAKLNVDALRAAAEDKIRQRRAAGGNGGTGGTGPVHQPLGSKATATTGAMSYSAIMRGEASLYQQSGIAIQAFASQPHHIQDRLLQIHEESVSIFVQSMERQDEQVRVSAQEKLHEFERAIQAIDEPVDHGSRRKKKKKKNNDSGATDRDAASVSGCDDDNNDDNNDDDAGSEDSDIFGPEVDDHLELMLTHSGDVEKLTARQRATCIKRLRIMRRMGVAEGKLRNWRYLKPTTSVKPIHDVMDAADAEVNAIRRAKEQRLNQKHRGLAGDADAGRVQERAEAAVREASGALSGRQLEQLDRMMPQFTIMSMKQTGGLGRADEQLRAVGLRPASDVVPLPTEATVQKPQSVSVVSPALMGELDDDERLAHDVKELFDQLLMALDRPHLQPVATSEVGRWKEVLAAQAKSGEIGDAAVDKAVSGTDIGDRVALQSMTLGGSLKLDTAIPSAPGETNFDPQLEDVVCTAIPPTRYLNSEDFRRFVLSRSTTYMKRAVGPPSKGWIQHRLRDLGRLEAVALAEVGLKAPGVEEVTKGESATGSQKEDDSTGEGDTSSVVWMKDEEEGGGDDGEDGANDEDENVVKEGKLRERMQERRDKRRQRRQARLDRRAKRRERRNKREDKQRASALSSQQAASEASGGNFEKGEGAVTHHKVTVNGQHSDGSGQEQAGRHTTGQPGAGTTSHVGKVHLVSGGEVVHSHGIGASVGQPAFVSSLARSDRNITREPPKVVVGEDEEQEVIVDPGILSWTVSTLGITDASILASNLGGMSARRGSGKEVSILAVRSPLGEGRVLQTEALLEESEPGDQAHAALQLCEIDGEQYLCDDDGVIYNPESGDAVAMADGETGAVEWFIAGGSAQYEADGVSHVAAAGSSDSGEGEPDEDVAGDVDEEAATSDGISLGTAGQRAAKEADEESPAPSAAEGSELSKDGICHKSGGATSSGGRTSTTSVASTTSSVSATSTTAGASECRPLVFGRMEKLRISEEDKKAAIVRAFALLRKKEELRVHLEGGDEGSGSSSGGEGENNESAEEVLSEEGVSAYDSSQALPLTGRRSLVSAGRESGGGKSGCRRSSNLSRSSRRRGGGKRSGGARGRRRSSHRTNEASLEEQEEAQPHICVMRPPSEEGGDRTAIDVDGTAAPTSETASTLSSGTRVPVHVNARIRQRHKKNVRSVLVRLSSRVKVVSGQHRAGVDTSLSSRDSSPITSVDSSELLVLPSGDMGGNTTDVDFDIMVRELGNKSPDGLPPPPGKGVTVTFPTASSSSRPGTAGSQRGVWFADEKQAGQMGEVVEGAQGADAQGAADRDEVLKNTNPVSMVMPPRRSRRSISGADPLGLALKRFADKTIERDDSAVDGSGVVPEVRGDPGGEREGSRSIAPRDLSRGVAKRVLYLNVRDRESSSGHNTGSFSSGESDMLGEGGRAMLAAAVAMNAARGGDGSEGSHVRDGKVAVSLSDDASVDFLGMYEEALGGSDLSSASESDEGSADEEALLSQMHQEEHDRELFYSAQNTPQYGIMKVAEEVGALDEERAVSATRARVGDLDLSMVELMGDYGRVMSPLLQRGESQNGMMAGGAASPISVFPMSRRSVSAGRVRFGPEGGGESDNVGDGNGQESGELRHDPSQASGAETASLLSSMEASPVFEGAPPHVWGLHSPGAVPLARIGVTLRSGTIAMRPPFRAPRP